MAAIANQLQGFEKETLSGSLRADEEGQVAEVYRGLADWAKVFNAELFHVERSFNRELILRRLLFVPSLPTEGVEGFLD